MPSLSFKHHTPWWGPSVSLNHQPALPVSPSFSHTGSAWPLLYGTLLSILSRGGKRERKSNIANVMPLQKALCSHRVTFPEARECVCNNHNLVAHRRLGQKADDSAVQVEESSRQHNHTRHQQHGGDPCRVHLLHSRRIVFMLFFVRILRDSSYHGSVFWEMW